MVDQPEFCCRTDELNAGTTIAQTFIASHENLCAVRVMFAESMPNAAGEITLPLLKKDIQRRPWSG